MIYFDNSATTKPCPEALKAINEALCDTWGNPSSSHRIGLDAHSVMESAAVSIGMTVGIKRRNDGRVIFTSGGTEANNLAIIGAARAKARHLKGGCPGTVIITEGEHSSVDAAAGTLADEGFRIVKVPTVGGKLDLDFLRENLTRDVVVASFMLVNNETGAIYDVKSASKIIKEASPSALIHSDCVQAYMKMRITPRDIGADMISISAHKIFSAKGAGALCVTKDAMTAGRLVPVLFGGGQEGGYRSGTEAVPAIAGFAAAAKVGYGEMSERERAAKELSEYAIEKLSATEGVRLNIPENRIANILNITVFNIKSETMLNFLSGKGICVSKSSACSTHSRNLSRALAAFGLSDSDIDSSLRLSFSHYNTKEEIDEFCDTLNDGIRVLAKIRK